MINRPNVPVCTDPHERVPVLRSAAQGPLGTDSGIDHEPAGEECDQFREPFTFPANTAFPRKETSRSPPERPLAENSCPFLRTFSTPPDPRTVPWEAPRAVPCPACGRPFPGAFSRRFPGRSGRRRLPFGAACRGRWKRGPGGGGGPLIALGAGRVRRRVGGSVT